MLKKLANIISIVFHPLLMTTLLIALLYFFAPAAILPVNKSSILLLLGLVLGLTYVLPLFSVGMLRLTQSVSSIRLENRKERVMPFFFISVYYGLTSYFFMEKVVLGQSMIVMFMAVALTVFLVAVLTIFYKISAHSVGTAGLVGFLLAFHMKYLDSLLFWPILGALVLHGIVSSARLYLNTHSPQEVHLGALLGFVISFGSIYIFT